MGKSVYSIVLDDDVVKAVDKLAYRRGTNRSGLINSILAESIGCVTPEMRMREIFSHMERLLEPRFLPSPQSSDSVFLMKTALHYKYNPTLRYSVELFRSLTGCVGRLKVSLRSQSAELIGLCGRFFGLWERLERRYCGSLFEGGLPAEAVPKGYIRDFYEVGGGKLTDNEIAEAITAYISSFDRAISDYISAPDPKTAAAACERIYKEYISGGLKII